MGYHSQCFLLPSNVFVSGFKEPLDARHGALGSYTRVYSYLNGFCFPVEVHGIDWSGARDAGRRIWIASGKISDCGQLMVQRLIRGEQLPNSGRTRERCLPALTQWIAGQGACAIGLDFPFGLPNSLMQCERWEDFVIRFSTRFPSPESFRSWCSARARGKELKRLTDRLAKTPFSPYNLRLFRQTYWGISGVLKPLLTRREAVMLPMQSQRTGVPWLLETCPASLLKRLGLYVHYKGKGSKARHGRQHIINSVAEHGRVKFCCGLKKVMLDDIGGDALDATLAAVAVARALRQPDFPYLEWQQEYSLEALVYT